MPTTNALLDRKSPQIAEKIGKAIIERMAKRCVWFREKVVNSMGTIPVDQFGRDYKIIKTFHNPVGGVIESDRGRARISIDGDATTIVAPKFHTQQVVQTFPDPLTGVNPNPYRLGIQLHGMLTNLALTMGDLDLEANPNNIGSTIAPRMAGFTNMVANHIELYWWLSQNNDYRLCAISAISAITSTTVSTQTYYTFTFEPDNLCALRFVLGDRLDMYDSTGTDRKNDSQSAAASQTVSTRLNLWVAAVSPMENKVTLAADSNPASWTGNGGVNPANGDILVFANSKLGSSTVLGLFGVESWLKFGGGSNDNYLLGAERDTANAIDVTLHPEFRSYLKENVGILTESKLERYLSMVQMALEAQGWQELDTLVCSYGVTQKYLEQKVGQYMLDRTGRPASISNEGHTGEFGITVGGRKYTMTHSNCMSAQTVYGLRVKGNWQAAVPPSGKGLSRDGMMGGGIPFEFCGKQLGMPGNLVPIFNATGTHTALTTAAMMPGRIRLQWVPNQPVGMKLTGVTEAREFSD